MSMSKKAILEKAINVLVNSDPTEREEALATFKRELMLNCDKGSNGETLFMHRLLSFASKIHAKDERKGIDCVDGVVYATDGYLLFCVESPSDTLLKQITPGILAGSKRALSDIVAAMQNGIEKFKPFTIKRRQVQVAKYLGIEAVKIDENVFSVKLLDKLTLINGDCVIYSDSNLSKYRPCSFTSEYGFSNGVIMPLKPKATTSIITLADLANETEKEGKN